MTDTRGDALPAQGPPDVEPTPDHDPAAPAFAMMDLAEVAGPGFVAGTMIATPDGERPVETLVAGDRVTTSTGGVVGLRGVRHRHATASEDRPLRIAAHAFADGRPVRDLRLAPGSRLRIEFLGEMLVPAALLFDAAAVAHEEIEGADYHELDLEAPEAVLADGIAVEAGSAEGDRPRAYDHGPVIEALRLRLADRIGAAGFVLDSSPFADLHLVVDGVRVDMRAVGLAACALVPVAARDVWLVSRSAIPSTVTGSPDRRLLGVPLAALSIDDGLSPPREIALDDPRLCVGFHEPEGVLRWTTGRARLPASLWEACDGHAFVRVALRGPALPRWVRPSA